jgi:hypothetical protein
MCVLETVKGEKRDCKKPLNVDERRNPLVLEKAMLPDSLICAPPELRSFCRKPTFV